jgi:hypothetical protein
MNYEINSKSLQIKKTMTRTTHTVKDREELMFSGRLCLLGFDILQYDMNQHLKPLIVVATSKLYAKDLTFKGTRWARIQLWPKQQQRQKNYKNTAKTTDGIWQKSRGKKLMRIHKNIKTCDLKIKMGKVYIRT